MKIITAAVNNPLFIELQFNSLKKYMKSEYEFIVFNDAKYFPDFSNFGDITLKAQIQDICKKYNITCINIQNDYQSRIKNASYRTADIMNVILEYQKENPDRYLLLDSDMFLLDDFTEEEFKHYDCAVVLQNRHDYYYIWNGLYYFNTPNLNMKKMNWHCTYNTDTGGRMNKWLMEKQLSDMEKNNIYFINHFSSLKWNETNRKIENEKLLKFLKEDPRNEKDQFYCEIYHNKFLHFRAGGNWKRDIPFHDLFLKLKDMLLE